MAKLSLGHYFLSKQFFLLLISKLVDKNNLSRFTSDKNTHLIDRQFMFGPAFLISPVLDEVIQRINIL
jgi:hypothetical protein